MRFAFHRFNASVLFLSVLYVNFVLLSLCMNEQFSFFSSTLYSCPCLCVSCDIFLNRNQQYVQKKTKKYEFFYICVYICISGVFFFFKTLEKKISSETKVMIHSFLFIQLWRFGKINLNKTAYVRSNTTWVINPNISETIKWPKNR